MGFLALPAGTAAAGRVFWEVMLGFNGARFWPRLVENMFCVLVPPIDWFYFMLELPLCVEGKRLEPIADRFCEEPKWIFTFDGEIERCRSCMSEGFELDKLRESSFLADAGGTSEGFCVFMVEEGKRGGLLVFPLARGALNAEVVLWRNPFGAKEVTLFIIFWAASLTGK